MQHNHPKQFRVFWALLGLLLCGASSLTAQISLERELVGAVGAYSVPTPNTTQELLVDDSFGETIIGYEAGDIIVTVGFHQPDISLEGRLGDLEETPEAEVTDNARAIDVNAFPNPTVERLTVDLGEHADRFVEIMLVDQAGRPVKTQLTEGRSVIKIDRLNTLPNANYFLIARDNDGQLHQVTTIMIITY